MRDGREFDSCCWRPAEMAAATRPGRARPKGKGDLPVDRLPAQRVVRGRLAADCGRVPPGELSENTGYARRKKKVAIDYSGWARGENYDSVPALAR